LAFYLTFKKNYSFCYIAKDVDAPDKVVADAADAPREIVVVDFKLGTIFKVRHFR